MIPTNKQTKDQCLWDSFRLPKTSVKKSYRFEIGGKIVKFRNIKPSKLIILSDINMKQPILYINF